MGDALLIVGVWIVSSGIVAFFLMAAFAFTLLLADLPRRKRGTLTPWQENIKFASSINCHPAEKRSIALLKRWLTPEQLAQFKKHGWFEVIGNVTKRVFRIYYSCAPYNVVCLYSAERFCFGPRGCEWFGDVMLAQKIAIETSECVLMRRSLGAGSL
jgi:hypothetical protein